MLVIHFLLVSCRAYSTVLKMEVTCLSKMSVDFSADYAGKRFFLLHSVQTTREANLSPPSSAKVKNVWRNISLPPHFIMVWCLINYRDKFYL
jgi:hypothetical protein